MGYKSTQDSNPATLELYIQIDAIYSKPEKGKQQVRIYDLSCDFSLSRVDFSLTVCLS